MSNEKNNCPITDTNYSKFMTELKTITYFVKSFTHSYEYMDIVNIIEILFLCL